LAAAGRSAHVVDLGGLTLIPVSSTATATSPRWPRARLGRSAPPPAGDVTSIEDIAGAAPRLGRLAAEHKYVLGVGYDDSMLAERRHPTKEDLDRVSTELPIWVVHASRHMAVGNSMALDQAGIAAATPDPHGGWHGSGIVRGRVARADRAPAGRRLAHVRLTFFPAIPDHHHPDLLRRTGEHYARLGITTAHDGGTDVSGMKMLRAAADEGSLPVDVVCYPLYSWRSACAAIPRPTGATTWGASGSAASRSSWTARPSDGAPG
jgi:predicted amidohydrolase YtcJ